MLNHTKKIKEIYEEIQRKLLYMIPEKWESIYLYSSVIENGKNAPTGELFFYYIPKGIFRKNPVNVYEVPSKFNIDENQYLELVAKLYDDIKILREEFKKSEPGEMWSNITISITNMKFRAEYSYEDLINNTFNSYERHVIWRYKYLGIGPEQVSKKDKDILFRYFNGARNLAEVEEYNAGIYVEQDTKNIIEYNTEEDEIENDGYIREDDILPEKKYNQIKSHKIENNWDSRRKKKTETMWSSYHNTSLEQYVIKTSNNNEKKKNSERRIKIQQQRIPKEVIQNQENEMQNQQIQQQEIYKRQLEQSRINQQEMYKQQLRQSRIQQQEMYKQQLENLRIREQRNQKVQMQKEQNQELQKQQEQRRKMQNQQMKKQDIQKEKVNKPRRNQILLFSEDEIDEE